MGFPPSRFLWRGGASDLEGFQTQALRHYSPAPVFYSAYSAYSLPNLLRFLQFRDQLAEAVSNSSSGSKNDRSRRTERHTGTRCKRI
jgi:hypothetical protein